LARQGFKFEESVRGVRVEFERIEIAFGRFVRPALKLQEVSQLQVSVGVRRFEIQGPGVSGFGIVPALIFLEGMTVLHPDVRQLGGFGESLGVGHHRRGPFAGVTRLIASGDGGLGLGR
jgi:hypothetical protein